MMQRLILFIPLLAFALLAFVLLRGLSLDPKDVPSALLGRALPEFALPSLLDEGQVLTQEDFKGQYALVNVWSSWCSPCRVEHPMLVRLSEQQVVIYGINLEDDKTDALHWLTEGGNPYRAILFDPDGLLKLDLGITGAPETFLISPKGIVLAKHIGVLDNQIWASMQALIETHRQENTRG